MRLGQVHYINPLPLFLAIERGEVSCPAELVPDSPAHLNAALAAGDLDVSLVSSFEYLRNRDRYALIPGLGVAADGPVDSVLLYVHERLSTLNGADLALTPESAASAQLLRLLCTHYWNVSPNFTTLEASPETYPAFLIIGDEPLRRGRIPGYRIVDLALAWREATGFPMVFALFAARREKLADLPPLVAALRASLAWGLAHPAAIVDAAAERSGLPKTLLKHYFSLLTHTLGEREMQGLAHYAALSGHPLPTELCTA